MARPKQQHPTPGELEILKILWEHGPATVREVLEMLPPSRQRAYTSVMSLLNVMTDKGLLRRKPHGRAFLYEPQADRQQTLGRMLRDLLGRAFEGSASSLVAHLLDESDPSAQELNEIRRAIEQYRQRKGAK